MKSRLALLPLDVFRFLYHLPKLVALFFRLMKDPRVPRRVKLLPWIGVIYFILPVDLIRDFPMVFLGRIDDLLVMYICLRAFFRRCPKEVVREHLEALSRR